MKTPLLLAVLVLCTALHAVAQTGAAATAKPDICKGDYESREEILAAAPEKDPFWLQTIGNYGIHSADGAWREELPNNAGDIPLRGSTLKTALADYCGTRAKAAAAGMTPQQYLAALKKQADAQRAALAKAKASLAKFGGASDSSAPPPAYCGNAQACANLKQCRDAGVTDTDTCVYAANQTAHCICKD